MLAIFFSKHCLQILQSQKHTSTTGACTIKTLRICNLRILLQLECLPKQVLVTNNRKDTSLLQNLAVNYESVMFYSTRSAGFVFRTLHFLHTFCFVAISQCVCSQKAFLPNVMQHSSLFGPFGSYKKIKCCEYSPWASTIKLFTAIIYGFLQQARVFALCKPFQSSLMFVGKARNLPWRGVPKSFFNWVGSYFTNKHQTRPERLARDKHSSLLQKSVNYGRKKFYSTGHWRLLVDFKGCNIRIS